MSPSSRADHLVDLAIADRADAAQLLGDDQVGLRRGEASSSRAYSATWLCIDASTVALISAEVAFDRSWVRRLTTGMWRTSAGSRSPR